MRKFRAQSAAYGREMENYNPSPVRKLERVLRYLDLEIYRDYQKNHCKSADARAMLDAQKIVLVAKRAVEEQLRNEDVPF